MTNQEALKELLEKVRVAIEEMPEITPLENKESAIYFLEKMEGLPKRIAQINAQIALFGKDQDKDKRNLLLNDELDLLNDLIDNYAEQIAVMLSEIELPKSSMTVLGDKK